jgi:DNA-binding NarL/FixJ family response regulator
MARGLSNHDIGKALSITESTVKFHINRILSKLGVSDRTQAVVVALKRRITKL